MKTVFISSTYTDLKNYRSKVWNLLRKNYDVEIKGMEEFGARTESPLDTCIAEVDQCDIYVGIIGVRLGSINEDIGKSYTQIEYERAFDKGKEILIYLIDEERAEIPPILVEKGDKHLKLEIFKEKLKYTHTVDFFVDEDDLKTKLSRKFDSLLDAKEGKAPSKDEIKFSSKVIEEIFLFPKSRSGQEIKLKTIFDSTYYPASKNLCKAFNTSYGNTLIMKFNIKAPENGNKFDKILVDYKQFEMVNDKIGKEIEIYANILFSETTIRDFRANFHTDVNSGLAAITITPSYQQEQDREGTIILSLSKVL